MTPKLFISQSDIDAWVARGQVDLEGDLLSLGGGALRLRPASFFRRVAGGGGDERGLVGKVKDEDALAALGAEAYMTSVLFDDSAYDVEAGYLATPEGAVKDGGAGLVAALARLGA